MSKFEGVRDQVSTWTFEDWKDCLDVQNGQNLV